MKVWCFKVSRFQGFKTAPHFHYGRVRIASKVWCLGVVLGDEVVAEVRRVRAHCRWQVHCAGLANQVLAVHVVEVWHVRELRVPATSNKV